MVIALSNGEKQAGVATLAQQGDSVKSAAWLNNQDYKGVI